VGASVNCGKETPFSVLYALCATSDDDRAWSELIRRFDPVVRQAVVRIFQVQLPGSFNQQDVEDACQDSWIKLCGNGRRHLRNYPDRSEGEFHMYLRKTAKNVVRDKMKRDRAEKRPKRAMVDEETRDLIIDRAPDTRVPVDVKTESNQIKERITPLLRKHWKNRPTCERDIVICNLRLLDELSAARIASIDSLGLSRGGVEKVIERGLKILQQNFGGPGARSRSVDDGHPEPYGPSGEGWRDSEEILDFVLGELDETTTARRMELLSRDDDARRKLARVASILDAPLDSQQWGHLRQEDIPEYYAAILERARRRDSARIVPFPHWPRRQAIQTLVACAAALVVLVSPLVRSRLPLGTLLGTGQSSAVQDLHLRYPSGVAAPLRLAQDFSAENHGILRGNHQASSESQMVAAEETLILQRSKGIDPVGTSNALAHLKLARGKLRLAEESYQTALRHDPLNSEALIGLAIVEYQRSLKAASENERRDLLLQAESLLRRVESSTPNYLRALYDQIQVSLALGKTQDAERLLRRYEEFAPDDSWAQLLRTAVHKAQQN
jgi:RNA polymerase sigma factor (sigma-70 family)